MFYDENVRKLRINKGAFMRQTHSHIRAEQRYGVCNFHPYEVMREILSDRCIQVQEDIEKYSHGARCTFCDFNCSSDCKFVEGKLLTRKI